MSLRHWIAAPAALLIFTSAPQGLCAVTVGQLDDFSVDLEDWQHAGTASAGLTRQAAGGPAGASDAYLRVASTGSGSAFSKLVAFNQADAWNGDYLAAGVTKLSMDVNNLGAMPITLRVALGTVDAPMNGGSWIQSAVGISIPVGGGWTSIQFPLGAGDFTGANYLDVIDSVATLRILHAVTSAMPGFGQPIAAALGIDNIRAVGAASIPGDFDHMGGVTAADLTKWRGDYGGAGSDADGDADSDGDDFLLWQRHLGEGTSVAAAEAVPEPVGAVLIAAAMFVAAIRTQRISTRRPQ